MLETLLETEDAEPLCKGVDGVEMTGAEPCGVLEEGEVEDAREELDPS